jgi:membrane protein
MPEKRESNWKEFRIGDVPDLFRRTAIEWMKHNCPHLGAALAYYTVFSLAPLVLLLVAIFGFIYGSSEEARNKIIEQLRFLADPSVVKVFKEIAESTAKPQSSLIATGLAILIAIFGASGVFGELQNALNTIWGVRLKPNAGILAFIRARFLSFAMVAGICFLMLVSLIIESILTVLAAYIGRALAGGDILSVGLFKIFDLVIVTLLFAMIFRFLPDAKISWSDVWVGAALTAVLFFIGKFFLGLYLASGAGASAYGAASSLITMLIWIYYSAQIMLFGAEFTQVSANRYGKKIVPEENAVRVEIREVELPGPAPAVEQNAGVTGVKESQKRSGGGGNERVT